MKKMENSFVVSGFVGKDASIHQFSTASVARFPLAINYQIVFHFQILHFCFCFEIKYMLSLVHLLCKG